MEEHECTTQSLTGVGSGKMCVGTGGKDMGTGSVYCERRDTLHMDDPMRLMAQANRAHIIAAKLGVAMCGC